MDEAIVNEDLQLRIQIVSLFKSGGWKLVEEKLKELKECYESEVQAILSKSVNDGNVALLNVGIGKVQALSAVLAIKEELIEQITPAEGDTSEDGNQEN